ncbi:hypothetical protein ACHAQA_004324 [Verticillium albo-atrum]
MPRPRRKLALLASLLLLITPSLAQTAENDFDLYPSTARPCLLDASDRSKCKGDDVPSNNRCLCTNGGDFITNAATCIGTDAPDTLRTVYSTLRTACSDSGTEVTVSEEEFLAEGAKASSIAATATTTRSSPSATGATTDASGSSTGAPTETGSPSDDEKPAGLSTVAKAGIGIGAAVGAAAFVGIVAMVCKSRRSRKAQDESHPMLGGTGAWHAGAGAGGGPRTGSPEYATPEQQAAEAKKWRPVSDLTSMSAGSPGYPPSWASPQQSQGHHQSWGQHPDQAWTGQMSPPLGHPGGDMQMGYSQGHAQDTGVYELASVGVETSAAPGPPSAVYHAVEMPGSQVPAQYNNGGWR